MGAVAITSQKEPAGTSGEPTPETAKRIDFIRQQEIQCLTDYYETRMRIPQDTHKEERRTLEKENQKLKNDIRVEKIVNTKLRKNYTTMMEVKADLQTELQQVKFTMKLQEDKDMDMIEIKHRREKGFLMEEMRDLRNFVKFLKVTNTNLKKDREERMKVQKELQEELQTLRVMNNKLQKKCDKVMGTEMKLRTELGRVKVGNDNLNNYWELKMKDCEEENKILELRNQELQKELEAIKKRGINTADDGKVSLHDFQFIRKLGEGAFGTVVLTKGKLPGGPKQLYAIKALKKRSITSSTICEIMAEKEVFMLTSGHPFITTMYCCFQNTEHLFFVMEYMSGGNLKEQLDEAKYFSEKRAQFYAAEIVLAVQFLHQHGILHRDLKLENVLVGSDGHCKITDFGLSKLGLFRHCKTRSMFGTPHYMAPELVTNLPYGQGVDWWAVGVMIYFMMTGHPPFYPDEEDMDGDSALERLEEQILKYEVEFPEDMSIPAISIVMQLLMKNSQERLGSTGSVDAVRHQPFFEGINWQALQEKQVQPPEEEKAAKKTEEGRHGFSKVLNDDNSAYIFNQTLFQGFSFMNYRVK